MTPDKPIRPLQDVWLRPRRVFRELSTQPIGLTDQVLGAAQGISFALASCRAKDFGTKFGLVEIFWSATVVGSVVGIASLYVMALIYVRLGSRAGRPPQRRQVVHVLAYGGVPLLASVGIWVLTALLAGEVTFIQAPRDIEGFVALLLAAQLASSVLLTLWSVLLQVMGFSEILAIRIGKAFGIWLLGQVIAGLAALFLYVLMSPLFPSA
ncbi:MAG TPA: YIP1 family protein [Steroidobacteraceae bacterium]|nr:YIP1 family protein [Steroidobacteraceae bacterium]